MGEIQGLGEPVRRETWFEAQVPSELALMLSKVTRAYLHRGKAARAAFLERLEAAIPSPDDDA